MIYSPPLLPGFLGSLSGHFWTTFSSAVAITSQRRLRFSGAHIMISTPSSLCTRDVHSVSLGGSTAVVCLQSSVRSLTSWMAVSILAISSSLSIVVQIISTGEGPGAQSANGSMTSMRRKKVKLSIFVINWYSWIFVIFRLD
ncbi:hypothetical protein DFP73DRAFT_542723 [Morchella snyderi]|nr:hypothetical protein DFP73DRAFT_542723 [Morchella snyderi]